jgi:hypothetical protein
MRGVARASSILAMAALAALLLTGSSSGTTRPTAAKQRDRPKITHRASAASTIARLKPPKPFREMTLQETEQFQKRAVAIYSSRWRYWQTHRARYLRDLAQLGDRLEICRGARAPHWACWNLMAARWTASELKETRAKIEARQYGLVVHLLEHGLRGSPMAGTGRELEAAGRRWHISPYFIAAIAATESSLGVAACGNFNAYGLANCSGRWSVPLFLSWADSYQFMGRFLTTRWPGARTPYDYFGYAACSSCWGRKTAGWMLRLFGVGPSVRYP